MTSGRINRNAILLPVCDWEGSFGGECNFLYTLTHKWVHVR